MGNRWQRQDVGAGAAEGATTDLVAAICVERFMSAPDARTDLTSLKDSDSWDRDDLIEEGGWVSIVGFDEPFGDAADACAEQLAEMSLPAAEEALTMPVADETAPIDG